MKYKHVPGVQIHIKAAEMLQLSARTRAARDAPVTACLAVRCPGPGRLPRHGRPWTDPPETHGQCRFIFADFHISFTRATWNHEMLERVPQLETVLTLVTRCTK